MSRLPSIVPRVGDCVDRSDGRRKGGKQLRQRRWVSSPRCDPVTACGHQLYSPPRARGACRDDGHPSVLAPTAVLPGSSAGICTFCPISLCCFLRSFFLKVGEWCGTNLTQATFPSIPSALLSQRGDVFQHGTGDGQGNGRCNAVVSTRCLANNPSQSRVVYLWCVFGCGLISRMGS
jgi:hypothetical protein